MLTTDKQRDEYIRIYDMTDKQTADRMVRKSDSITKCGDALREMFDSKPLQKATINDHGSK